jgi:hypothetical protein
MIFYEKLFKMAYFLENFLKFYDPKKKCNKMMKYI